MYVEVLIRVNVLSTWQSRFGKYINVRVSNLSSACIEANGFTVCLPNDVVTIIS